MPDFAEMELAKGQMPLEYSAEEMAPERLSMLDLMEKIIDYTEAIGISDLLFQKAFPVVNLAAERLNVTPMQMVLFAMLFSRFNASALDEEDLANLFRCTPIKLLRYMNDLETLQKKRLIIPLRRGREGKAYRIPADVVNAIRRDEDLAAEVKKDLTIDEFFSDLEDIFDAQNDGDLSQEGFNNELKTIVDNNMHLLFCGKLASYKLCDEDARLLLCFCHLYVNNCDDNIGFHDFEFIFDKKSHARAISRQFREGDHTLICAKFIENTNCDGYVNREAFKLSDFSKNEMLAEIDLKERQVKRRKGLLLWESITEKKLFFNEKENREIARLVSLLKEENFKNIQEKLSGNGMRKGFACLFSGSPGTGKTETVYQIARETHRSIMVVDISSIKDMYVGETEKHMKAVFDNYRTAVSASDIAPILLFNEADAIIGKRMEFGASSHAVDRMENTMQNIILQELENLSGILIATTNLTRNMDKAFERRFLYKIEFEKPGLEVRQSIWQSLMPDLAENEAKELSSRFDFSGGQIENISRKRTVDMILDDAAPSLDDLIASCKEEVLVKENPNVIGFIA
ncbi:ATP-binding protein [Leadbettera azotonutricia]|uniref:ATPase, AAA family n=1 Tax=Leadbettera azotonutricia (strain ATCC BAA-888 / DSM 13862 / ZAS-9) TaxID=545695 RepID=F5YAN1_LEAAZ|nr:ATP-binding protein [Leadbettera azotonutricia]AEF83261.1 ATPase, AAA family [Leadbettera azotonutricia ZAS-9]